MNAFSGQLLFLDRSDINTDEIIPAKYLTEIKKQALKPFLLEDLKLAGFNPETDLEGVSAIISRSNFGCGSSREHAAWALEVNGIRLVIAQSFARIFRQNMFNCGLLAVELSPETVDHLFVAFSQHTSYVETDLAAATLTISSGEQRETIPFAISKFDRALIEAGGWLEYADSHY